MVPRLSVLGGRDRVLRSVGLLLLTAALANCDLSNPPSVWGDPSYDHSALSGGFQLLGTHADLPCIGCHASGNYAPLFQASDGSDCKACHLDDYERKHGAFGYPVLCSLCHPPTAWSEGSFDHTEASGGLPLLQVHATLPCTACHDPDTFLPLFDPSEGEDCLTCHVGIFPAWHTANGFPSDCRDCHTPTAWEDGSFDHLAQSGTFELLGIHRTLRCTFCHEAGSMEPAFDPQDARDCVTCHRSIFEAVHGDSGYPTTCTDCHAPTEWGEGEFNHPAISGGFELLGSHGALACTACHDPETFDPLTEPNGAEDCVACHRSDYDGQHGAEGYPTDCTLCHFPTVWADGTFDHGMVSGGFHLLGTHESLACTACHDPETFEPESDPVDNGDCLACHQTEYDGQHANDGYPTDCTLCHTPTVWSDGTFEHQVASGGFRLLGIHEALACVACHHPATFQPVFSPSADTDCVSCHQAEYDGQHATAGYPADCTLCHTPTTWSDADFDHDADYFPIFTGEHAPRWSTCATCHVDPENFADFSCFECHAHGQTPMDQKHNTVAGYTYASSACLACHPTGTA